MMTEPCPEYVSLVVHAADDTLDARDRARFDAHLAGCAGCREALDSQTLARSALAGLPAVEASPFFAARVRAQIETPQSWTDRIDFRRWTWRVAPLAAGLALAAFTIMPSDSASNVSSSLESDVPVSAALWSDAVSDTSVLSLMLEADVDASLDAALAETTR